MELFSEIYSAYYRLVGKALKEAAKQPLSSADLREILSDDFFSESTYFILPKLLHGDWPLIREENKRFSTPCSLTETSLTTLQRSWLKSLLGDRRFSLFFDEEEITALDTALSDVQPLYCQSDLYIFDNAVDGDDYSSGIYRSNFRSFLAATRNKTSLFVEYEGGKGHRVSGVFWPYKLEYSQKDDKFRAACYRDTTHGSRHYVLNLGRVTSVNDSNERSTLKTPYAISNFDEACFREVIIEISRERNALERCMVHFAHFEKRTEYNEKTDRYTCVIRYNSMDETEVVIRILSFGPTIRVLGPEKFLEEICERVKKQAELLNQSRILPNQP